MKLDDQTSVLVAIGSAAAVNCHACLRRLADRATALEVSAQEVAAAVKIGLRVNRAAGGTTETFASTVPGPAGEHAPARREFAADGMPTGASDNGCCVPANEGVG